MGLYIKGVGMPEHCWDCPCHNGEYEFCQVTGKYYGDERQACCPLVELPSKHGRLVDADLAMEKLETDKKEAYTKHDVWLKFSTYGAPTVLEAEE
jgi:hypothetical protein